MKEFVLTFGLFGLVWREGGIELVCFTHRCWLSNLTNWLIKWIACVCSSSSQFVRSGNSILWYNLVPKGFRVLSGPEPSLDGRAYIDRLSHLWSFFFSRFCLHSFFFILLFFFRWIKIFGFLSTVISTQLPKNIFFPLYYLMWDLLQL